MVGKKQKTGIYKRIKGINYFPEKIGFQKGHKSNLGKHWKVNDTSKMGKGMRIDGRSKNREYRSWIKNKRNRMPKTGEHTFGEWELLKKQYGYICPCCKKQEPEIKLTEDHIIPLSKGGSDYIENIQPLCRNCNCKKHTKTIKYDK